MIGKSKIKSIAYIILIVIIISIAQTLIKTGMNKIQISDFLNIFNISVIINIITSWYVVGGFALYAITLVLLLGVMSKEDVSFVYPLLSIGYIITAIFAIMFLNEFVSVLRWGGIALIFLGSFFIGKS
jgi:drug/metabolite transporter (DMT)-like permease